MMGGMKQCDHCHQQFARVHRYDVTYPDGAPEVKVVHLCRGCARDSDLPILQAPSFSSVIQMLSKSLLPLGMKAVEALTQHAGEAAAEDEEAVRCDECGWTMRDLRQTSRFGCPKDYDVFAEVVPELLERLHGVSEHCDPRDESVLDRLTLELQEAVAKEDYETAARLRDEIRELEAALEDSPLERGEALD